MLYISIHCMPVFTRFTHPSTTTKPERTPSCRWHLPPQPSVSQSYLMATDGHTRYIPTPKPTNLCGSKTEMPLNFRPNLETLPMKILFKSTSIACMDRQQNTPTTCSPEPDYTPDCTLCGSEIDPPTLALTGNTCGTCRDKRAVLARRSWCIAPISNKAAYTLITDLSLLKQINPKRTC
jgi:hypothetical protein